jgi:hypothetical protein
MSEKSFTEAVATGDTQAVASLLREDTSLINARDPESGVSAILTALYHGKRPLAEFLVASNVDA